MAIPDGKPATDFSAMNREWVRAVATEAGEGALPSVSGSDNGKVLTVVSGEWDAATPAASGIPAPADPSDGDVLTYSSTDSAWVAAAPSGGGGESNVVLVTLTYDDVADDGTFVSDKSFTEISNLLSGGKIVMLTDGGFYMPCNNIMGNKLEGDAVTPLFGGGISLLVYSCTSGTTWSSDTIDVT